MRHDLSITDQGPLTCPAWVSVAALRDQVDVASVPPGGPEGTSQLHNHVAQTLTPSLLHCLLSLWEVLYV